MCFRSIIIESQLVGLLLPPPSSQRLVPPCCLMRFRATVVTGRQVKPTRITQPYRLLYPFLALATVATSREVLAAYGPVGVRGAGAALPHFITRKTKLRGLPFFFSAQLIRFISRPIRPNHRPDYPCFGGAPPCAGAVLLQAVVCGFDSRCYVLLDGEGELLPDRRESMDVRYERLDLDSDAALFRCAVLCCAVLCCAVLCCAVLLLCCFCAALVLCCAAAVVM